MKKIVCIILVLLLFTVVFSHNELFANGGEHKLVDKYKDNYLYLDKEGKILENKNKKFKEIGPVAVCAQYDIDGDILYINSKGMLLEYKKDGKESILLPEHTIGINFFVHPSGRYIAYHKLDYIDENHDTWAGLDIAIYDREDNKETLVMESKGDINHVYGWVGDKLLIELTNNNYDYTDFRIIDIKGNIRTDERFMDIPKAWSLPELSPDKKWLTFETNDGINLVSMQYGNWGSIGFGTSNPTWTKEGMKLIRFGEIKNIDLGDHEPKAFTKTGKPIKIKVKKKDF